MLMNFTEFGRMLTNITNSLNQFLVKKDEFEVLKKLVQKQELAIRKLSNKKKTKKVKKS